MEKDKTFLIYALCDPDDDSIQYIGQTCNIKTRYANHIRDGGKKVLAKRWVIKLKSKGKFPTIKIIESGLTVKSVDSREIYWIAFYRKINPKLKNMTTGGDGGKTHEGKPTPVECSN